MTDEMIDPVAARAWTDLKARSQSAAQALLAQPQAAALLDEIFNASSFLTGLILGDPDFTANAAASDPQVLLSEITVRLDREATQAQSEMAMRRILRQARQRAALLIALA